MAQIKIKVPADWPDFGVTSYYRPESGSHGKYRAIDISPVWTGSRDKSSPFWFYLFQTYVLLIASQRRGTMYIAAPPNCPHIHIDTVNAGARFGVEHTAKVNGVCKAVSAWSVDALNVNTFWQGLQNIKENIGAGYWTGIKNKWLELKYNFQKNEKYITVHSNGFIGEADLQAKLDVMFGDGSSSQRIKDTASQIVGYINADDAPSAAGIGIGLLLAVAAFMLYKD